MSLFQKNKGGCIYLDEITKWDDEHGLNVFKVMY